MTRETISDGALGAKWSNRCHHAIEKQAMHAPTTPSRPEKFGKERRTFLKVGVAGSALLLLGRWLPPAHAADPVGAPQTTFAYLTAADVVALLRIVPIMLEGALPQDRGQQNTAIGEILRGVDLTIGHQALSVRAEIRELFDVLTKSVTRALVAGIWKSWDKVSEQDVRDFLASWRNSRLDMLRTGYIGLNNLIVGSWYGNPRSWARIGYAGPPKII